jgi:hypothetical protein
MLRYQCLRLTWWSAWRSRKQNDCGLWGFSTRRHEISIGTLLIFNYFHSTKSSRIYSYAPRSTTSPH